MVIFYYLMDIPTTSMELNLCLSLDLISTKIESIIVDFDSESLYSISSTNPKDVSIDN